MPWVMSLPSIRMATSQTTLLSLYLQRNFLQHCAVSAYSRYSDCRAITRRTMWNGTQERKTTPWNSTMMRVTKETSIWAEINVNCLAFMREKRLQTSTLSPLESGGRFLSGGHERKRFRLNLNGIWNEQCHPCGHRDWHNEEASAGQKHSKGSWRAKQWEERSRLRGNDQRT